MKLIPLIFAAACGALVVYGQGSLTPPGAPAPMMKTLDQIEPRVLIKSLPYTITNSGSYALVTNLTSAAATNGITVAVSDVAIDLNNFSLTGGGEGNGVFVEPGRRNVSVKNGTIKNWAVGVQAPQSFYFSAEQLTLMGNSSHGLVAGSHTRLLDTASTANSGAGFGIGVGSVATRTRAVANGNAGFYIGEGSTLDQCEALNNNAQGMQGDADVTIKSSTVRGNGGHGVLLTSGAHVVGSTIAKNKLGGLLAGDSARVSDCHASGNAQTGITTGGDSQVINCKAGGNGAGIDAGAGSVVEKCAAQKNNGPGIRVFAESSVKNNHCTGNFNARNGAGIYVGGTDNVIEGNYAAVNDQGIVVSEGGNLLRGNTAANNSINYLIVGEQVSAPTFTGNNEEITRSWSNAQF